MIQELSSKGWSPGDLGARACKEARLLHKMMWLVTAACMLVFVTPFSATLADEGKVDLTELSLEDLMNVEVSSVSKKAEPISEAAAAIYVLSADDIRRSGAMTIPDALRMVPGVQVAQIDANKWAVTARGFNGNFANKLLVLIDGRSVYTPLYSGVYWDVQDVVLEDIERIEVIRGPGATLWGANAVNGVINILTKSAMETNGSFISAGSGSYNRSAGELRLGKALKENLACRVYGKWFERNGFYDSFGHSAGDSWKALRGGFRADWKINPSSDLTVQGDGYDGKVNTNYRLPSVSSPYFQDISSSTPIRGGNLLTRWATGQPDHSRVSVQLYHDWTERHDAIIGETRHSTDFDVQHIWTIRPKLNITSGIGYRLSRDNVDSTQFARAENRTRSSNLFSTFVQATTQFFDKRVTITVGSKLEHNDFTGFEIQPSLRWLWAVNDRHSIWSSVSRAVRTPSRGEHDGRVWLYVIPPLTAANPTQATMLVEYTGTASFKSESVVSYEAGYRGNLTPRLWLDAAAYYNHYDGIISGQAGAPEPPDAERPYIVIPYQPYNGSVVNSYGLEIATDYRVSSVIRTKAAYTFGIGEKPNSSMQLTAGAFLMPRHQVSLQMNTNPLKWLELGTWARYVDQISESRVPSYWTLDMRVSLNVTKQVTFSVTGKDLLEKQHQEFVSDLNNSYSEAKSRVFGAITWRY
jgi:iron complex outermembrane recepter protein